MFANAQKKYTISGTINPSENNSKIFIIEYSNEVKIIRDSTTIKNGKFEFKGNIKEPDFLTLTLDKSGESFGLPFVLEEGKIVIVFDKENIEKSKISGTSNNNIYQQYIKDYRIISTKIRQFEKDNNDKRQTAIKNKDTLALNNVMDKYWLIQNEFFTLRKKFIDNNPRTFVSLILIKNSIGYPSFDIEELNKNYESIDKSLLETKLAKKIKKSIDAYYATSIGQPAPEFEGISPKGRTISLKKSLGKVTILDFWASWCGPCREENPTLVALYKELHEKGLNIISISEDIDDLKWKQAIEEDGLIWNHVSNLTTTKNSIKEQYNVREIPVIYILDEKGIIIAKNLRGEELKAKIKELF